MGMSKEPSAISHQPLGKSFGVEQRGQGQGTRIGLVAAIKEEIAPFVRGWTAREIVTDGHRYRFFEKQDSEMRMGLVCSGIGAEHGRRATEALIQESRPSKIISVGYAGALGSTLKVADIVEPRTVVNSADGSRIDTGSGQGILISSMVVADRDAKHRLADTYGAIAVDMEGASAAAAAQAHGIEFVALKAISDPLDFAMPPVQKFVSARGQFRYAAFALHVMVRPWMWWRTIALARNSAKASQALCRAIEEYLSREGTRASIQAKESEIVQVGFLAHPRRAASDSSE
jgi:adenosylhomocysteine nucleosidase